MKIWKDDIMLMGSDVWNYWETLFLHSMRCYMLKMNKCGKVCEVSNKGVYWVLPHFSGDQSD